MIERDSRVNGMIEFRSEGGEVQRGARLPQCPHFPDGSMARRNCTLFAHPLAGKRLDQVQGLLQQLLALICHWPANWRLAV